MMDGLLLFANDEITTEELALKMAGYGRDSDIFGYLQDFKAEAKCIKGKYDKDMLQSMLSTIEKMAPRTIEEFKRKEEELQREIERIIP